jgi:hypothetical protein
MMPKFLASVNGGPLAACRSAATVAAEETLMDFDTFMTQAWNDHATDARGVARRLGDAVVLATDEAQLTRLMDLAHHVHGAHLGAWRDGIAFIEALGARPAFAAAGASGQARRRCVASLALADGAGDALAGLAPSDRIRATAMAAGNLAEQDALDAAGRSALPATDPMNRALAVAGNNLASALEEKTARSAAERELMILAAQTGRQYWALAGTWLETERAEYRLAMTWLQAGDAARARTHAQACLDIVAANDGAALERLFGWEALGLAERAAGNAAGHALALAQAREAFAALDESDKAWCAETLDKLAA